MNHTLNKEEFKNLVKLSRIQITAEEEDKLFRDIEKVLLYASQLKEVNTEGISPCYQVQSYEENVWREDEVSKTLEREDFLNNSPSHIGGMIKVPPIINF
ncbi:MAG: Asp-tRNA(Asn)/Glu-tRNA(Gln) amidotransferase subunit GatC [Rhabdochlamydiaceae bacterium]